MTAVVEPLHHLTRPGGVQHHVLRASVGVGATVVGLAGASWAGLLHQAKAASALIEAAAREAAAASGVLPDDAVFDWQALLPDGDGVYLPDGSGPFDRGPAGTRVLTMLGDSTAVGYGCTSAAELPGVVLAREAAAALGCAVRVTTRAVVGSVAADLDAQIAGALADRPDAVAILVGANDVSHRVRPRRSAALLGDAVAELVRRDVSVVVATCPDLGVIMPIRQPLRSIVGLWSRVLARKQERAVRRAGGVPVSLSRLVSPEFYGRPDLFYADGYHPSGPGYARAVAALQPAVNDVLRQAQSRSPSMLPGR